MLGWLERRVIFPILKFDDTGARILANPRLGVMSGLRSAQWPRILASARPHYLPITTTISAQINLTTAAAAAGWILPSYVCIWNICLFLSYRVKCGTLLLFVFTNSADHKSKFHLCHQHTGQSGHLDWYLYSLSLTERAITWNMK